MSVHPTVLPPACQNSSSAGPEKNVTGQVSSLNSWFNSGQKVFQIIFPVDVSQGRRMTRPPSLNHFVLSQEKEWSLCLCEGRRVTFYIRCARVIHSSSYLGYFFYPAVLSLTAWDILIICFSKCYYQIEHVPNRCSFCSSLYFLDALIHGFLYLFLGVWGSLIISSGHSIPSPLVKGSCLILNNHFPFIFISPHLNTCILMCLIYSIGFVYILEKYIVLIWILSLIHLIVIELWLSLLLTHFLSQQVTRDSALQVLQVA